MQTDNRRTGIVTGKWDRSHTIPDYRRRFFNHIDWARAFGHRLYLDGRTPHDLLVGALEDRPVDRALELAGGRGDFSLYLLRSGIAKSVDMIDVSAEAIRIAGEKAAAENLTGLRTQNSDVNRIELRQKYDLVVFSQALHHIERLEHVMAQIRSSLQPRGLLYVSDYIGPNRMQWSDEQLNYMNDLLSLLPRKLRKRLEPDGTEAGGIKSQIDRIPIEVFEEVDPSEAVRSQDIQGVLRATFGAVQFFPTAGTLAYELFRNIAHNFDVNDENVRSLVRMIIFFERDLVMSGRLEPNFGVFLCRA